MNFDKENEEKRIPRPPNAFMIYGRTQRRVLAQQYPEMTNKQISKILGQQWRNLETVEKNHFHKLAEEAYQRHMQMYPNYYYSPLEARQRKAERKRKYMMKCGRKMSTTANQQEADYAEQLIAIQAIPQPDGEQQEAMNNLQLIPVICHHPIQTGNHTLLSFSLAPMNQFYGPVPVPMNVSEEEAAVRHCYDDLPPEPPTIYHVSYKDPNLGEVSEEHKAIHQIEEAKSEEAYSIIEVNPQYRDSVIVSARKNQEPKVIVKKEPPNDGSDPFIFSSTIDILNSD